MLDDFGVQDDVEPLAGACQILGEGMPVIDVDADECRVGFRDLDQLGGRIDADDPRPEKSRRLAEEPAAAADIENAEPGKRRSVAGSRPLRRATRSRMKARRTGLS